MVVGGEAWGVATAQESRASLSNLSVTVLTDARLKPARPRKEGRRPDGQKARLSSRKTPPMRPMHSFFSCALLAPAMLVAHYASSLYFGSAHTISCGPSRTAAMEPEWLRAATVSLGLQPEVRGLFWNAPQPWFVQLKNGMHVATTFLLCAAAFYGNMRVLPPRVSHLLGQAFFVIAFGSMAILWLSIILVPNISFAFLFLVPCVAGAACVATAAVPIVCGLAHLAAMPFMAAMGHLAASPHARPVDKAKSASPPTEPLPCKRDAYGAGNAAAAG